MHICDQSDIAASPAVADACHAPPMLMFVRQSFNMLM